jgi:hypothetical protein
MIDILHDSTGDLIIANNDLVIGTSDVQHQNDLLLTEKGSIKQFPDAGVGAASFLESEDGAGLLREIGLQFTGDGMDVKELSLTAQGIINVNAVYK